MDPGAIASASGTLVFTGDAEKVIVQPSENVVIPRTLIKNSNVITESIRDFMAKPISVSFGTFSTSNVANDTLYSSSIAAFLANTMWKNKWNGHHGIRATCVIRVELNAMPFHAGLLMLKVSPGNSANAIQASRTQNIAQFSQMPGAIFSLRQTEAIIKVPYRGPWYFYDLTSSVNQFDWGTVYLKVYSPMRTAATSSQSVDYSVWVNWEDVELCTPTLPQSAWGPSSGSRAGIKMLRKISEPEKETGPVSKVFGGVSSIASGLGSIPMLSSIMGHTKWFSDLAQGLASSYGWSKPPVVSGVSRMAMNLHAYDHNVDGSDASVPLGLIVEPSISPIADIGYSSEDEMSINFIKRQWSHFQTLQWSTSSAGILNTLAVRPLLFQYTGTDTTLGNSINWVAHTPISFLSSLSRYWRGSVEVRLRIAKTDYHSGRLQVAWAPGYTDPLTSNYEYLMREIIDIRHGDTFCFTLPYMVMRQWSASEQISGYFKVTVVNSLRAASTVDSTVDICIEVRGGLDLEFSLPNPTKLIPYRPQMDATVEESTELRCATIGGVSDPQDDNESEITMGELFVSFSQLVKRHSRVCVRNTSQPTATSGFVYPYSLGGVRRINSVTALTLGALSCDNISLITSLYAFWRGGIRYRMLTDAPANQQIGWLVNGLVGSPHAGANALIGDNGLTGGLITNLSVYGAASVASTPGDSCGFSYRVPAYQPGRYRETDISFASSDTLDEKDTLLLMFWDTIGASPFAGSMWRAASDDFQCGLFVCIPILCVSIS
jgi:hypothetical protein